MKFEPGVHSFSKGGVTIIYWKCLWTRSEEIWVLTPGSKTRTESKKWDWAPEISEFFWTRTDLKDHLILHLIL